ncbi:MAG: YgiQ family radical SAM protein [Gammaproteobacteria bacterium]|nr:YgiQ family radical SAM protein [Gammaproteobacteria bacterium]MBU1656172.1 YgiQ family radical SAM protein [Gammaproteobacteria bacterium]MBU1961305.1 YgiQ family radical SAM protein [Gammaproteobacteria bacterium]
MKPIPLFSHRKHWAAKFGPAPFLPMSRAEMDELGWDSCDILIVTGDAYVDHPSFGMAVIGRVLEAQGFRVGIISQPDWDGVADFQRLGRPNLFFGVTGGNMDSMVNRYTSERRLRSDDAYTPDGEGGRRPDRAVLVYSQRCREAYRDVPIVLGGIEASLRRLAHYDYWSDRVRRSLLLDAKADILLYGNAERAVVELAHRLAAGEAITDIEDLRGTVVSRKGIPEGWRLVDEDAAVTSPSPQPLGFGVLHRPTVSILGGVPHQGGGAILPLPPGGRGAGERGRDRAKEVVRLPAYEQVRDDPLLYAQASRLFHLESNPGNARALVQRHGDREIWVNPPPIPLTTPELDGVFELPYQRVPHPAYGGRRLPAYEMIRFSINIMRGCFGGCTFCSITEHEGRIIQNRSEGSILREIETLRDSVPGFTGHVSDLGGPTANMWRLHCKDPTVESNCRRLSCVFPVICKNLNTGHRPLVRLYRKARELKGIKKVFIASGVRYDLAAESPEYVKELVTHHVGGYLKIAPEHTEPGPLALMMKPGIGVFDRFKRLFDKYSKEAGKEQYLIPYFIAAHPGTSDLDMLNLALWLKENGFRPDQVQAFLPSPMALATAMYHTGLNPLKRLGSDRERVFVPSGGRQRRLHKAFLRYHDAENWPLLREALKHLGRADLIGNGKKHLIPAWQPQGTGERPEGARTRGTVPSGKGISTGRGKRRK